LFARLLYNLRETRKHEKLRLNLLNGGCLTYYYERYATEAEKSGFCAFQRVDKEWRHLFNILATFCQDHNRVLDVGCGPYELIAVSNKPGTVGTDIGEKVLKRLKAYGFRGDTVQAHACALPFQNGSFDCLVSAQMIEHLLTEDQVETFAKEVQRLSCKIMIITPNCAYQRKLFDPTHFFFFTTRTLKRLLQGFRIYGALEPKNTILYYALYDHRLLKKIPYLGAGIQRFFSIQENSKVMRRLNKRLWVGSNLVAVKQ
jgi:2-polyprenyl-3-methyl-5-hydroxy-6-metoxy-1,4-benzoquinol methylase